MKFEDFLQFLGKEFSFDTSGITPQTTFEEINFDEFDMIELVMSVEDSFRIEIDEDALTGLKTLGQFAAYLKERM